MTYEDDSDSEIDQEGGGGGLEGAPGAETDSSKHPKFLRTPEAPITEFTVRHWVDGSTRTAVSEIRKTHQDCQEGVHWYRGGAADRVIYWTPEGVAWLRDLYATSRSLRVRLEYVDGKGPNRLLGRFRAKFGRQQGQLVTARLTGRREHYMPGLEYDGIEGEGGIWDIVSRAPRWRGDKVAGQPAQSASMR